MGTPQRWSQTLILNVDPNVDLSNGLLMFELREFPTNMQVL